MKKPRNRPWFEIAEYWAYTGNEEGALRNGSFLRSRPNSSETLAWWMNGDYLGEVAVAMKDATCAERTDVKRFAKVPTEVAARLIPDCCKTH